MLPAQHDLQVLTHLPAKSSRRPPLLFVHGGFCDAWCWEPHFLPYFARKGYPAHALSLRGHGESSGRESLFVAGLDDYAVDVEHVASKLAAPPVLIGHSMGAAVVERLLATRPLRGAALLAPVPPGGLGAVMGRFAGQQPDYLFQMQQFDPTANRDVLEALRPMYFSDRIQPELLAEMSRHLTQESPRALFDLTLRLHVSRPVDAAHPLVLGATGDKVCTPDDVRATAALYGVEAKIVPGLAHMLMLEPEWKLAADAVLAWLEKYLAAARR